MLYNEHHLIVSPSWSRLHFLIMKILQWPNMPLCCWLSLAVSAYKAKALVFNLILSKTSHYTQNTFTVLSLTQRSSHDQAPNYLSNFLTFRTSFSLTGFLADDQGHTARDFASCFFPQPGMCIYISPAIISFKFPCSAISSDLHGR